MIDEAREAFKEILSRVHVQDKMFVSLRPERIVEWLEEMNKSRGRRLTVALVLFGGAAGVLTQFASFMFLVSAALLVAALVTALRTPAG